MSRLADPSICPDCRAALDPSSTCTDCGLRLDGPPGERLWQAMLGADRLVEEIRAGAPVAHTTTPAITPTGATGHLPAAPPLPPRRPRRRLPVASVPGVLLSLGALCLLVAATVFVAIAWGSLGITGRTLVLLGVTAVTGGLAAAVTMRGLRAAAESLWTITAGMLVLDLLAARAAGLAGLDTLGWRATSVLVGGTLFLLGAAVSLWAHRTPAREVWATQVFAVLGACTAAAAACWLAPDSQVGSAVAAPVLLALALGLRSRLPGLATGLLGLALFSWCELALLGITSAVEPATWGAWWSELRGWPLAVAAGYAATIALTPRLPHWVRSAAAGAALALLAVLANAPITPGTPTRDAVVLVATVVALALVAALASRPWASAAAVVGGLLAAGQVGQLVRQPLSVLEVLPSDASVNAHLPAVASAAAPWVWILVGLGVAALALAATRTVRAAPRDLGPAASCAVVAIGGAVAAVAAQPLLWAAAVASLVASGAVAVATWSRRAHWSPWSGAVTALSAGYLLLVGLALAEPSPALSAVTSTLVCLLMAAAYAGSERRDEVVTPAVTGALAVVAGAYALFAWGATWSTDARTTAGVMAVFSALVALAAAPASRRRTSRLTLELVSAVPAIAAAVLAPDLDALALVLTVVGSGLAGLAVLHRDRTDLGWFAACLLGTATALRVLLDVRAPELYTLPAAILLLAAGAWRLRTDREADSVRVLGSGLALALAPSLLLALQEPVSLRALLVGAGGAAALAWGSQQRIAAPLVAGAGTMALLTLRELEPMAEAVPRWLTLALLGAVLLGAGVTWESRLRNLRAAGRYLTALR